MKRILPFSIICIMILTMLGFISMPEAASPIPEINMEEEVEHHLVDDGHGHVKQSGLPQFDPTWFPSQIFWLMLTFGIMYLAFSRKILPAIAATIDNREQHVTGDLETADRLTKEANNVHDNYEKQLYDARQQAHDIMAAVEEDLKKEAEQQIHDFTEKSVQETSVVKSNLDALVADALQQIEGEIAEISTITARQIAGIESSPKDAKSVLKSISKPEAEAA